VLQEQVEHLLLEPNDYYARFIVASAYQESGKYDLALEHYQTIVQSAPSLPEQVIASLEAIVRAAPNLELAHRLLGDTYLKQGRSADAIAQYNLAVELQ
jgi:cytochrome c-type biogenesis protein CcmH/NrfG